MSEAFPPLLKRIETEPLVLRPVELGDVDEVFAYVVDPEWSQYLSGVRQAYKRTHAEQDFARQLVADWATEHERRAIGKIHLDLRVAHRRASLGYVEQAHSKKSGASISNDSKS